MGKAIEGKQLYLRFLKYDDLDRTWEWLHRPDVYNKIGVKTPFSKEEQKKWYASLEKDKFKKVFAVCKKDNNIHIGNVSLDMIDIRHGNARLSIFIADHNARGKGYGSEALQLLEKYAFDTLKLHKIWCKTDAGDEKVLNFYHNLRFIQEGRLKEHERKDGIFVDKVLFGKINSAETI